MEAEPDLWWGLPESVTFPEEPSVVSPTPTRIPAFSERDDCSPFFQFHRNLLQAAVGVVLPVRWIH